MPQRTDAESAILTAKLFVWRVWRREVVLVGGAAGFSAALDSRQAAAKRADRDRRATHAPQCSPFEDGLFFADGVSVQSQCAIDAAGQLILQRAMMSLLDGTARICSNGGTRNASAREAPAAALAARFRCVENARCTVAVPRDGWWRSSGDAEQNAPTSRRSHTI